MTIDQRLRKLRYQRGWTIRGLAKIALVDHNTIFNVEMGRGNPTWKVIRKLSEAFGLTVSEFLEGVR